MADLVPVTSALAQVHNLDLVEFAEWLEGQRSAETSRAYRHDLEGFAAYLQLRHHMTDWRKLTVRELLGYPKYLHEELGLAYATVARKLSAVRAALDYLVALGWYSSNPAASVKAYPVPQESPRVALTIEQTRELLAQPDRKTAGGARDYALLLTMATLALRRSEVARLRFLDFSRERSHLRVRIAGKGSRLDYLPVPPHVEEAILAALVLDGRASEGATLLELTARGQEAIFRPFKNNRADLHGVDQAARLDKPLAPDSVLRIVTKYAQAAGLDIDAHTLRGTAITCALDKGGSLRRVQAMARHSNSATTTRYDSRAKSLDESAVYLVRYEE
jgi:site-specific recombinase XerD